MRGDDMRNLMAKAVPLNGNSEQQLTIDCQNVFPNIDGKEVPACPITEPTMVPVTKLPHLKFVRLYHPCIKECQLWSAEKNDCKLAKN